MPVAATMTDVSNITFSDGSNFEDWSIYVEPSYVDEQTPPGTYHGYYLNRGTTYVDGQTFSSTQIRVRFVGVGTPTDINAGDTFTITHAGGSLIIYCPVIFGTQIVYYPDENGVLYSDSALTTAVTPDFDNVIEIINADESESETSGVMHVDIVSIVETTSTESSNSLTESIGISELVSWYIEGDTQSTWPTPTVHYTGSNPYDTDNPIFDSRLVAETDPVVGKTMKVFIKDDNEEWIDFSDRFNQKGIDKLADYGQLKHASEKKGGLPIIESTIGSLTLDNSDGFFDGRAVNLLTDLGNVASFETSSDEGTETSWRRREVKFELHLTLIDDTIIARPFGVFTIKEMASSISKKNTIALTLESKMNLLKRTDASIVKDGNQWYRDKSISFLVNELLKLQFANDDDELPDSFFINDKIMLTVPDDVGGGRAYSHYGAPPQDQSGRNIGISFVRSMCLWHWNTGTVASTSDYSYSLASNSTWGSEGISGSLRPKTGDYITIKSSSNGNDGEYKIKATSGTLITLEDPLKGTTESGMSYTVSRLYYLYNDAELWEFNPISGSHSRINQFSITSKSDVDTVIWDRVPYQIFVHDNRIYTLLAYKPRYDFSQTKTFMPNEPTDSYTRLFSWNGDSISTVSSDSLGGGRHHSSPQLAAPGNWGMGWTTPSTGTNNDWSHNWQNPYTQFRRATSDVQWSWQSLTYNGHVDEDQSPESTKTYPNEYIKKGFHSVGFADTYFDEFARFYFFWDRGPFEVWVSSWGGDGKLVTLYSNDYNSGNTTHAGRLDTWNKSDDTLVTYYVERIGLSDHVALGVCAKYMSQENLVFCSVLWRDNPSDNTAAGFSTRVYGVNEGGYPNVLFTLADKTILDMEEAGGSGDTPANATFLISSMIHNDNDTWYELGYEVEVSPGSYTYYRLRQSSSPFIHLTRGGVNENYDVFLFHKYENKILRFDWSTLTIAPMANGAEVVAGEGHICTPLIIDKNTRPDMDIIYGVSWSGEDPWATAGLRLPAKGVLWKLDKYLTPSIELADFDGLSVGEAIGRLAQACNHVALFNLNGDFFFVPKDFSDVEDYVIEHIGGKSIIAGRVGKDRGYGEVYNYFTVTPSVVRIAEVEWEMVLISRELSQDSDERDTETDGSAPEEELVDFKEYVEINSNNNLKRKVRLACTEGGYVVADNPKFKFVVEYDNIDVRVGESISSDQTEFLLNSTFGGDLLDEGVHTGDFIILTDNEDLPYFRRIMGGQGGSNISGTVSGANVPVSNTTYYSIGDKVHLRSSSYDFSSSVASVDTSSLILNDPVPTTYSFTSGDDCFSIIKGSPAYISIAEDVGVEIEKGSEAVVIRVAAADDQGKKAWSSDSITHITSPSGDDTNVVEVDSIDFITKGCWIRIDNDSEDNSLAKVSSINTYKNELTLESNVDYSKGDSIGVFWAFTYNEWIEIPQSAFEAKLTYDAYFKEGDIFTIETEGLELEDDSKSRKIAVSLSSKDKHGKLDFPTIKNRFIYPVLGEILTRTLLDFYKWPRYHLTLPIYYLPLIDFIRINRFASYKIVSDLLFPNSKDFTRSFYLRSVSIDIKKNIASLGLVDKDAY